MEGQGTAARPGLPSKVAANAADMDIPYKGYTIIPNSERQPDGRWLPVADLEASSRGVVTPKPPLRAAPREIRATRADADAVAVKMAKAWIEAIERDEASSAPIGNAVATPRIPPEHRIQDARVKAPPRARRIETEKRPIPTDTLIWPGLHDVDCFTRLLAVHSLLDRLVTLVLAMKLAASSETFFDAMASLPISSRVTLASTLNVVPPAAAESILEIDRARNRLVHSKPTSGKPDWDVSAAVESVPQDVYDKSLRKGLETAQGLMSALRAAAQEI
jgi:hypothetical protein